jgi:pre-mRNA-splicing factor CDC5/CEF1
MRADSDSTKRSLQASYKNLPNPESKFGLLVPDDEGEDDSESGKVLSEEDAAERDARIKRRKECGVLKL